MRCCSLRCMCLGPFYSLFFQSLSVPQGPFSLQPTHLGVRVFPLPPVGSKVKGRAAVVMWEMRLGNPAEKPQFS